MVEHMPQHPKVTGSNPNIQGERKGGGVKGTARLCGRNTNLRRRLSTVVLLNKVACFVKHLNNIEKELNYIVQGGPPYGAFPFSKTSLLCVIQK